MLTKKELEVVTLRQEGLTQNSVAKRLKITQAAVSKFEHNAKQKILDAQRTVRLAKQLGLEADTTYDDIVKQYGGRRR